MSLIKLNWKPEPKELRQFGAIFLAGCLLIGLIKYFWKWNWLFAQNQKQGLIFIALGLIVGGVALTGTRIALPFYWLWMSIAFVMGNIMSRVVIGAIYFLVITPLGFLGRIIGRDKLQLKKNPAASTYWLDVKPLPPEIKKYERQF